MGEPRALTVNEVRAAFLDHVAGLIRYWDSCDLTSTPVPGVPLQLRRLEGLAFSLLVTLDGGSMALPGFIVAPSPHPDDEAYQRDLGESWFPRAENHPLDIAGSLHEQMKRPSEDRGDHPKGEGA